MIAPFYRLFMPFQLCTWPLPLNTCFACYHNHLQVCGCMCASASFLRWCLFVISFFFKRVIVAQTVPGKRSKQGRCTYLRCERRSLPRAQMTAEHFCHLLIYSVVFSSNSSNSPPLNDLNPFFSTFLFFSYTPVLFHSLIMKAQNSRK